MSKTDLSIIIPNWNGVDLLEKHLPAVIAAAAGAEIIVADDCSTDDSVRLVKQRFPRVRVVAKNLHEGFASTVNAGVDAAKGNIVLLLNTDVEPEKGFLQPLLSHFTDETVFAVGCLEKSRENGSIVLRGRGQARWKKGFYTHWRGEIDKADTAWVSGGSGAFRKSIWEKLGGMDSLFNPFYWEDIDLSYRALKAGYRLVFEPKSIVEHFHEEGKIMRGFSAEQIKKIAYRNQFIFIWKNLSDLPFIMAHCIWTPIRLVQSLIKGDWLFLEGYLAAMFYLPAVFLARRRTSLFRKKSDREAMLLTADS